MLDTLADGRHWTVVALDYTLGYLLEPATRPAGWQPGYPLIRAWRFAHCTQAPSLIESALAAAQHRVAGVCEVRPAVSENWHAAAVDRIQHWISEGDCYQVNLTFPIDLAWYGDPLALYARLRAQQPVRYGGVVSDRAGSLVSLSPELFLERRGGRLLTRPMKGTLARELDPARLRNSEKDRAENLMIVDLLRNDLGRVARPGSVRVDALFDIEPYPTVWQMVSSVSAEVGEAGFSDILRALFPCGSITGAPKIRAMQIIQALEAGERGLYTGALGWIAPSGDFRLNVAIRTLELAPEGRGRLGVGSGIVADSQASAEWAECLLKSAFLRGADPGLQLIETLRLEAGNLPRAPGHLARLQRSAKAFGFPFDPARLAAALADLPTSGVWRVRLTLAHDGAVSVTCAPLLPESWVDRVARLAEVRIRADDPLRRHKTTFRPEYDAALAALAQSPECFDVVFLNERGEVAEGARSNVFVERDGVWLTPPVSSGALPGVLRAELLESGQAREAVLWPEDLQAGFWLGNALRGLVPVRLTGAGTVPALAG